MIFIYLDNVYYVLYIIFILLKGVHFLKFAQIMQCLECNPVIAAVQDDGWDAALKSPAQILFYLSANLLTISDRISQAHNAGKYVMIHMDLAEGIGKDKIGIRFVAQCGADGILSTKANLIRFAKEQELVTVQRFFMLDSKGMDSVQEMLKVSNPHFMEVMPGVIGKAITKFSSCGIPVIAGGLIQTKAEVTDALGCGATAVSTGKEELWYL